MPPPPLPLRLRLPRIGPGRALVAAVTGFVGFVLVAQLQSPQRLEQPLAAESEGNLARILAGLNAEGDALQAEIADLKVQLIELRQSSQSDASAARRAEEQLRALQVLAGTVPVTGPGVVVEVADPERSLTYDAMIDVVQELRDAGAEAVAVNGLRVGVASAFSEQGRRITLDGSPLDPPYRIAAIGQPATLDGGLKIPGGAVDAVSALGGVRVQVQRLARVDLPALLRPPDFKVARPVGSGP